MEESNASKVNEIYDFYMFSGDRDTIGFHNNGYWKAADGTLEQAQIYLVETLVAFFVNKNGNVLDVACGKGASTKFLAKYFDPRKITAINISKKQLELCRLVAPACDFRLMNAAALDFEGESIDNLLCIEAAFHFQTRERFLREAWRVMKPGARLAMSDILLHPNYGDRLGCPAAFPEANYLESLDDLRGLLFRVGFRYVRVEDSTEHCLKPFQRHLCERLERDTRITPEQAAKALQELELGFKNHIASCMVYAIK